MVTARDFPLLTEDVRDDMINKEAKMKYFMFLT